MGILVSDSKTYGVLPLVEGVSFIQGAFEKYKSGKCVSDIVNEVIAAHKGKPYIVGYKQPIAKGDERLEVMERVSESLGFREGPHMILAYEIEKDLLDRFDEGMNINGFMSAFLSDQGFSADEVYRIFATLVGSGVTACYLDTLAQPAESFIPLRCADIEYKGPTARPIPNK